MTTRGCQILDRNKESLTLADIPNWWPILRVDHNRPAQNTGCCGARILFVPRSTALNDTIMVAPKCYFDQPQPPVGCALLTSLDIAGLCQEIRREILRIDRDYTGFIAMMRDNFEEDMYALLKSTSYAKPDLTVENMDAIPEVAREATDAKATRIAMKYKARMTLLSEELEEQLGHLYHMVQYKEARKVQVGNTKTIKKATNQAQIDDMALQPVVLDSDHHAGTAFVPRDAGRPIADDHTQFWVFSCIALVVLVLLLLIVAFGDVLDNVFKSATDLFVSATACLGLVRETLASVLAFLVHTVTEILIVFALGRVYLAQVFTNCFCAIKLLGSNVISHFGFATNVAIATYYCCIAAVIYLTDVITSFINMGLVYLGTIAQLDIAALYCTLWSGIMSIFSLAVVDFGLVSNNTTTTMMAPAVYHTLVIPPIRAVRNDGSSSTPVATLSSDSKSTTVTIALELAEYIESRRNSHSSAIAIVTGTSVLSTSPTNASPEASAPAL